MSFKIEPDITAGSTCGACLSASPYACKAQTLLQKYNNFNTKHKNEKSF